MPSLDVSFGCLDFIDYGFLNIKLSEYLEHDARAVESLAIRFIVLRDHLASSPFYCVAWPRLFDVLDLMANSATTVINAVDTYSDVKKRINDYKTLLNDYNEKLLLRGNIMPGDTIIISVGSKAVERIYEDGKNIYTSMTAIVAYGTGKVPCNTTTLLSIVQQIDESFDDIRKTLNSAYITTWRYIQLRQAYYKAEVYNRRSGRDVSLEALERWKASSKDALRRRR